MEYYRNNKGQTLVELVVVLAVVGMIVTGVVSIAAVSVRNARFSKDQASASRYAQEAMEWIRQERDTSWSGFYNRRDRTYCMPTLSWSQTSGCNSDQFISNTQFIRTATLAPLTPLDENSVQVDVSVSWSDARGSHQSRMSTVLTSWKAQ